MYKVKLYYIEHHKMMNTRFRMMILCQGLRGGQQMRWGAIYLDLVIRFMDACYIIKNN